MVLPVDPPAAHPLADQRQRQDPGDAAGHGQRGEAVEAHAGDAGGQRDERADHRQQPAEEDRRRPVALEPGVCSLELGGLDVERSAVLLEQLDPPVVADAEAIHDRRAPPSPTFRSTE